MGGDNIIVEGHGRQRAAIELGIEKVPCIRLDDMTDEQRREYSIRHNRSAEMSGWDFGKLEEELGRLEEEGIDLKDLKFEFDSVDADEFSDEFSLKDGDREPIQTMNITLADDEAEVVNEAIKKMKSSQKFKDYDNPMNKNSNGNALFLVADEWLQRKI